jgi:hypothetical protein
MVVEPLWDSLAWQFAATVLKQNTLREWASHIGIDGIARHNRIFLSRVDWGEAGLSA